LGTSIYHGSKNGVKQTFCGFLKPNGGNLIISKDQFPSQILRNSPQGLLFSFFRLTGEVSLEDWKETNPFPIPIFANRSYRTQEERNWLALPFAGGVVLHALVPPPDFSEAAERSGEVGCLARGDRNRRPNPPLNPQVSLIARHFLVVFLT
jgi:hypothetical protein